MLSDHGENLGEFGRGAGHGDHLYGEYSLGTALAIRDPVHRFAPAAPEAIVRDVDVAPTLAALLSVKLPRADGVDLTPLLAGQTRDLGLAAFGEADHSFVMTTLAADERFPYPTFPDFLVERGGEVSLDPAFEDLTIVMKQRSVCWDRWKLIYTPTRKGVRWNLYDHSTDPFELRDLASSAPPVLDELKRRLYAWMTEDGSVVGRAGIVVPRASYEPPGLDPGAR